MENIEIKNNSVGNLYKINLEKNTIYNIFTKAGNYRGGKIYSLEKKIIIISGKIELTTFEGEKDIKKEYNSGEIIKIPAGIPNIFYFPENSEILEFFPKNTKIEKFDRYYKMKK